MVKPVLIGHLGDKEKLVLYDLLKEVQFNMKFSMTGQEKSDLLNQVTA